MRIVDAHFHLWDLHHIPQPWIDPETMTLINRSFDLGDYYEEVCNSPSPIDAAVLVQTIHHPHETAHLLRVAHTAEVVAGVVGWVDLLAENPGQHIETLRAGTGGNYLTGVRYQLQEEPGMGALADPRFHTAMNELTDRQLAFDLIVRADQLGATREFVSQHPDQRFVLDHLGKPSPTQSPQALEDWHTEIAALAQLPNVYAKLSGLVTQFDWEQWRTQETQYEDSPMRAQLEKLIAIALEEFGPYRLLFASDWPVLNLASNYETWTKIVDGALSHLSRVEQEAVWGANATHFYSLANKA